MFTSSADVFRTRQALGDLRAFVARAPEETRARLIAGMPPSGGPAVDLLARVERDGLRFNHPDDAELHSSVLLAAAMPDDDFPVFLLATAFALADLMQSDAAPDTLFWNWDAFHDQYVTADAPARAALLNGFRVAELAGRVALEPRIDPKHCLRVDRETLLEQLEQAGERGLHASVLTNAVATDVGRLWVEAESLSGPATSAFRYFYEREVGLAPPSPETAPLIPF